MRVVRRQIDITGFSVVGRIRSQFHLHPQQPVSCTVPLAVYPQVPPPKVVRKSTKWPSLLRSHSNSSLPFVTFKQPFSPFILTAKLSETHTLGLFESRLPLSFHCHTFRKIAGLVHVSSFQKSDMVRQQLYGKGIRDRCSKQVHSWKNKRVTGNRSQFLNTQGIRKNDNPPSRAAIS